VFAILFFIFCRSCTNDRDNINIHSATGMFNF